MRRAINISYIIIPLAYVLVIAGLLFLQFSGGNLFRNDLGPVALNAAFTIDTASHEKTLSSLTVDFLGLHLSFDKTRKIRLVNQADAIQDVALVGYLRDTSGFRLDFEQGVQLRVDTAPGPKSQVQIQLTIPASLVPLKAIRLPFALASDARSSAGPNAPALDLNWKGADYTVNLPSRSFVDSEHGEFVIPGDAAQKSFRVVMRTPQGEDIVDQLTQSQTAIVGEREYQDQINSFFTAGYNGWKGSRYGTATGTWAHRDGENRFDESILVAYLSEAWQRGEYTRAFTDMRTAGDQHPDSLTWRSSVFLGNLKRITNEMLESDARKSSELVSRIEKNDADIFLTPGLIQFAVDRGSQKLIIALKAYIEKLQPSALTPLQSLGVLQQLYVWNDPDPSFDAALQRFQTLIKDSLLANIVSVEDGYFFQSAPGKSDTYLSALAGRVIEKAGKAMSNDHLASLGRTMVLSVLKLSDDLGYLPETIQFSGNTVTSQLKSRGAEDLYELLNNNPSFPQKISLFKQLGYGHWFYTLAKINNIAIKSNEYTFSINYPRSRTHYLFFAGLPKIDPLEGMQLFGIMWRNASDFEVYSKGRFYNPDTGVLMIKYFDDSTDRDIKIWYR